MTPEIPAGMTAVTQKQFFKLLKADPRDIMPKNMHPDFTTWETWDRYVWGWTTPGWKSPYGTPEVYAVVSSALSRAEEVPA